MHISALPPCRMQCHCYASPHNQQSLTPWTVADQTGTPTTIDTHTPPSAPTTPLEHGAGLAHPSVSVDHGRQHPSSKARQHHSQEKHGRNNLRVKAARMKRHPRAISIKSQSYWMYLGCPNRKSRNMLQRQTLREKLHQQRVYPHHLQVRMKRHQEVGLRGQAIWAWT